MPMPLEAITASGLNLTTLGSAISSECDGGHYLFEWFCGGGQYRRLVVASPSSDVVGASTTYTINAALLAAPTERQHL